MGSYTGDYMYILVARRLQQNWGTTEEVPPYRDNRGGGGWASLTGSKPSHSASQMLWNVGAFENFLTP